MSSIPGTCIKYRPAIAGKDQYNGAVLRIGAKIIKLGNVEASFLLAQEIADRWNCLESIEPLLGGAT
jgi:hypothetical protein